MLSQRFAWGDPLKQLAASLAREDPWAYQTLNLANSMPQDDMGKQRKAFFLAQLEVLQAEHRRMTIRELENIYNNLTSLPHLASEAMHGQREQVFDMARWCGAVELRERGQWGLDITEQNMSYTANNHRNMVQDRSRVEAYAGAIRRLVTTSRLIVGPRSLPHVPYTRLEGEMFAMSAPVHIVCSVVLHLAPVSAHTSHHIYFIILHIRCSHCCRHRAFGEGCTACSPLLS
jgi:hypothetical protein